MFNIDNSYSFIQREIDGELVYCIECHQSGFYAIFDHDDGAVDWIKEEISRRGISLTEHYSKKGICSLIFHKTRNGWSHASLASVLYSYYSCRPLDGENGATTKVKHRFFPESGEYEDCRSSNLYAVDEVVMDTDNRSITISPDGKYIVLYLKHEDIYEYLSYSPELLKLIGKPQNMRFSTNQQGRVKCVFNRALGVSCKSIYLSALAYAVYHLGITEDNLRWRIDELNSLFRRSEPRKEWLEVDHANNDFHNHCKWNLSLIPAVQNGKSGKIDFSARIKRPYYLYIAVTESSEYRLEFGYTSPWMLGELIYVLCPDIHHLISFLKKAMEIAQTPIWLKRGQTTKACWQLDKKAPHAAMDFQTAANHAEKLLKMEESDFTVYDITNYNFPLLKHVKSSA